MPLSQTPPTSPPPSPVDPVNPAVSDTDGTGEVMLSPTEDLLMEALAARHRLGYTFWEFETRHKRTLRTLAAKGLLRWDTGVTGCPRAFITAAGIDLCIDPDLVPPALDPECRSAYFGERTSGFRVDCVRKARHKGKHRARFGDWIHWSDEESWGGLGPLEHQRSPRS